MYNYFCLVINYDVDISIVTVSFLPSSPAGVGFWSLLISAAALALKTGL
jgi:hypothetical protein